ncbi:MAG: hypothetical protein NVSMB17_01520 [Candidatus Dormibacteria bacterium]
MSPLVAGATPPRQVERPSVLQADDRAHAGQALSFTPAAAAESPTARPSVQQPRAYNSHGLNREVFGFAPYWELSSASGNLSGSDLSDLQYDKLSTIAYFGLTLNSAGGFDQDSGMAGWNSTALAQLLQNAHAAGDRVQLVVKQFDQATICGIVSSPTVGQAAITNSINAARGKAMDGLNVDFEGGAGSCAGQPIQPQFSAWIASLYRQAHAAGLQLTLDAYSSSASDSNGFMRIDTLAPNVDAFFIMAYDMSYGDDLPNSPLAGPYTYTDTQSVDQFSTKAGAGKVILGIPYYGYKFSTNGNGFHASQNTGAVNGCNWNCSDPYSVIVSEFQCAQQLQRHWDAPSLTPWAAWYSPAFGEPCTDPPGGAGHNSWRELYYDNADSLALKYDLVNNRGIRGAGIWALGYDHGSTDLWAPIRTKFQCAVGPAGPPGYSILNQGGGIYSFGDATYYGNLIDHGYPGPAVGLGETPDGHGYNILTTSGAIYSFGNANYYGNLLDHGYPGPATALSFTPAGGGYAILTRGGGIYTFGDARYYGNLIDHGYPGSAIGFAYTASGNGYWILTTSGALYSFGDAGYYGNLIDHAYPGVAASIAAARDGKGYGILTTTGALYTFGSQPYLGNLLDHCYPGPAVAFSNTP